MSWSDHLSAVLEDEHVRLTPISEADRAGIRAVALDPEIWRYFTVVVGDSDFDGFFDSNLAEHTAGRRAVYVITDLRSGRVAGSMSLLGFAEKDRRLEIGASWLGHDFRGKGINHWAKLLLLRHAFEVLEAERVEFKTDELNVQARKGLRNIGATEEGVLRSFNYMPGGRRRDAVFYSILRAEWPGVREALAAGPKKAAAAV
ncbi:MULTISPECIES: GNAT family N-acetyltransferase [Kitasatospora]|uniref:RimJ/RimL family protein N-acetyltransferase n=1 Tax=Kitasatospora cineracea TaxID=88074 RepID=A0A3N4REX9_9ACTN|nr:MULTISPECIES: GNAT family N-acetyltransferase [Kitasatospora]ROR34063.1 RimJ/RimL family protein N-acetyltransferase [Kitasatospora cineracea]RPE26927.1 RimJ/RimL family protein N-acetyltransferase [Kitasatospora cineracea]